MLYLPIKPSTEKASTVYSKCLPHRCPVRGDACSLMAEVFLVRPRPFLGGACEAPALSSMGVVSSSSSHSQLVKQLLQVLTETG